MTIPKYSPAETTLFTVFEIVAIDTETVFQQTYHKYERHYAPHVRDEFSSFRLFKLTQMTAAIRETNNSSN